jgi:hypothetical protein
LGILQMSGACLGILQISGACLGILQLIMLRRTYIMV